MPEIVMDATAALALARFVRDGAASLLWGGSVYLLLAPPGVRAPVARACDGGRRAAVLALVAAVLALLPVQAAAIGRGWPDAFDPGTIGALLSGTALGTAWLIQGAAAMVLLFVAALPGPWRAGITAVLAAQIFASLALSGHAATHDGGLGLLHRAIHLGHLLAGGFWFGALPPLLPTLRLLGDPGVHGDAITALRRYSVLGHAAVAVVILSGTLDAALILGGWPSGPASSYVRLLCAKILLVVAMTGLALLNRYGFVPGLREAPARAIRRIRIATLAEVAAGAGAIALVALFGLLDPG